MKKLALVVVGLFAGCATSYSGIRPKVDHTLNVTYDRYHFKFESMDGKFEHAELYERGKKYLCFESLKPANNPLPFSRGRTFYDYDGGSNCDGVVDLINHDYFEIKRPSDPLELKYDARFTIADNILARFKKDYQTKKIRQEWLKKKDSCKKGSCSFEVERTLRKKITP